jgi:hypothetical protein
MQAIDILNFKKYFKKKGDNALAKVGHVNSLIPIMVESNPNTLGIVPAFIGQIAIVKGNEAWIAFNDNAWGRFYLD